MNSPKPAIKGRGRGKTASALLERLCTHTRMLGADTLEIERKDGRECVFARKGSVGVEIASYPSDSAEGQALRRSLQAAGRKRLRALIDGRPCILEVQPIESFGDFEFLVKIREQNGSGESGARQFTAKQGQYLAFIYYYTKVNGRPPAETDMQRYFRVSAPSVHQMVVSLQTNGWIERTPGEARSIQLLIAPDHLPQLM